MISRSVGPSPGAIVLPLIAKSVCNSANESPAIARTIASGPNVQAISSGVLPVDLWRHVPRFLPAAPEPMHNAQQQDLDENGDRDSWYRDQLVQLVDALSVGPDRGREDGG